MDTNRLRAAHRLVHEIPFEVTAIRRGYADRILRIDLAANEIRMLPVTQQMKDLWVGGKGFDLWLTLQEIGPQTRWDSPENPICMSPGPLAGTTSFPGAGKTLVTSISPITGSIMDCNVGGFFGPLLKFCGFDALVLVGKAPEDSLVVIDAARGRITIERAPLESVDGHLVAEELTAMYADDEFDRRNVSVVCAGRGAEHTRMGVLNFSFYDWRKRTARIKQAGRGGIGRVFRDKRLKALVVKNRGINPAWSVAESKVAREVLPRTLNDVRDEVGRAAIGEVIAKWNRSRDHVLDMLRDVQERFGYVPRSALEEITLATSVPTAYLYHLVTFLDGFHLAPLGTTVVQVCNGTSSQLLGAGEILAACERALGVRAGETTPDGKYTLLSGPCLGACSAAPVVRLGSQFYGHVQSADIPILLEKHAAAAGVCPALSAQPLSDDELAAVSDEEAARAARARGLLAICTGRRTPAGAAGKASADGAAPARPASGTTITISGHVRGPATVTIAPGTTLRAIIDTHAGGLLPGRAFKAAQIGGPSGAFLSAAQLDQPVDFAALATTGSLTGPDRTIIMDETTCMVALARHIVAQLLAQSCGKCTPCREGLHAAAGTLKRITDGGGREDDLALLENLSVTLETGSACQFGVWAANPLRSALAQFREEFIEHARGRRCRAGACAVAP